MTMHDHSLLESYVLDHFSTDRHNKVVQTTSTKIFWDFEGLGIVLRGHVFLDLQKLEGHHFHGTLFGQSYYKYV